MWNRTESSVEHRIYEPKCGNINFLLERKKKKNNCDVMLRKIDGKREVFKAVINFRLLYTLSLIVSIHFRRIRGFIANKMNISHKIW